MIFNGAGFIGHHAFVYPNIKALIPNGFNADGSLKSTLFESNTLVIAEIGNKNGIVLTTYSQVINPDWIGSDVTDISEITDTSIYHYVKNRNLNYIKLGTGINTYPVVPFVYCAKSNNIVTKFDIVQPVRLTTTEILDKVQDQVDTNTTTIAGKQDTLVSGTNIKTINNTSILGSGNIDIQGGGNPDNKSITENSSEELQTVGVIDANDSTRAIKTWTGTKEEYNTLFNLNWDEATQNTNLGQNRWGTIACDGTKFVAISEDGYVSTSLDGRTWTQATQITSISKHYWYPIAYGNGKFVAIDNSYGEISISTDGLTWTDTNYSLGDAHYWSALCYGDGKFVAVDDEGIVGISTDGINWNSYYSENLYNESGWHSIIHDGSKFIILNSYNYISTSTDGINWTTPVEYSNLGNCNTLAYDGIKYVAFGGNGYVSTSTDGITWTVATQDSNLNIGTDWTSIVYGKNRFIAIQSDGYISVSELAVDQNTLYNIENGSIYLGTELIADKTDNLIDNKTLIKANNIIHVDSVTNANDSTKVIKTWTGTKAEYNSISSGTNWNSQPITTNLNYNYIAKVIYDGTKFVALSTYGEIFNSTDGITWTKVVNYDSDSWCCLGCDNDGHYVATSDYGYVRTSINGITWTNETEIENLGDYNEWRAIIYTNKFMIISKTGYISTSIDGTTWTVATQDSQLSQIDDWIGITNGNNKFVLASYSGYISTSTDGITWTTPIRDENLEYSNYIIDIFFDGSNYILLNENGGISVSNNATNWSEMNYVTYLSNRTWIGLCKYKNNFAAFGYDYNAGYVCFSDQQDPNTLYNIVEDGLYLGIDKVASYSSGGSSVSYDDKSITQNSSNELQTVGIINSRDDTTALKLWTGTKAQYDAFFSLTWSDAASVATLANKTWCYPVWDGTKFVMIGSGGVAATSTDGITWTDYSLSDYQKWALTTANGSDVFVGKATKKASDGTLTNDNVANVRARITLHVKDGNGTSKFYSELKKIVLNIASNGASNCKVKVSTRTIENYNSGTDTWVDRGTYDIWGWSAWNSIPFAVKLGGYDNQTGYNADLRLEFWSETVGASTTTSCLSIKDIRLIGVTNWIIDDFAKTGHLYSISDAKTATFPSTINFATPAVSDNSTKGATTAWVKSQGYITSSSSVAWNNITGTPTTISGYGITDAYTKTEADGKYVALTGNQTVAGVKTFNNEVIFKDAARLKNNITPSLTTTTDTDIPLLQVTTNTDGKVDGPSINRFVKYNANGNNKRYVAYRAGFRNAADTGNIWPTLEIGLDELENRYAKFDTQYALTPIPTEDTTSSTQIDTVGARNTKLASYQLKATYDSTKEMLVLS